MCELFGVNASRKIPVTDLLRVFYSHSAVHQSGWGLALEDRTPALFTKEAVKAADSPRLSEILEGDIRTAMCIAHIRRATIGVINAENAHPFRCPDISGRTWTLAHNGTIFESEILSPYQYLQKGTTDSERILLYIVDEINKSAAERGTYPDAAARIRIVENAIRNIVAGNKVNLMLSDGDLFYLHINDPGTMHIKELDDGVIFSTNTLEKTGWTEIPHNRLFVYRNGEQVYAGQSHEHTYIHDEEKMRILFFAYAGL